MNYEFKSYRSPMLSVFGGLHTRFWFSMNQSYDWIENWWIYSSCTCHDEAQRKKWSENGIPSKSVMGFRGETKAISSVRTCKTPFRNEIGCKDNRVTEFCTVYQPNESHVVSWCWNCIFSQNLESSSFDFSFVDDFGAISAHVLNRLPNILLCVEQILTTPKWVLSDGKKVSPGFSINR